MTNQEQAAANAKEIADDEGWTCKYTSHDAYPFFEYSNGFAEVRVYSDGDVYVEDCVHIDRLKSILALPRPVHP